MTEQFTPSTDQVRRGASRYIGAEEFDRWLATHDAELLAPIRAARANHPECKVHPDDDSVTCGWKRAVLDIDAALDRIEKVR